MLTQKGTCLATNSSSLPVSLRKDCLQRHVLDCDMIVLSRLYFLVPGLVAVISKSAKVDLAMLFQCKCSGTGQNEAKLSLQKQIFPWNCLCR